MAAAIWAATCVFVDRGAEPFDLALLAHLQRQQLNSLMRCKAISLCAVSERAVVCLRNPNSCDGLLMHPSHRTRIAARPFLAVALAVVMVTCLGRLDAGAQTGAERIAAVRENSTSHLGPFYFKPTLLIHNIGVDDNVFIDPDTKEAQSDFTFTVTPRTSIFLPLASRALISADVATGLVYYKDYESERALNPAVSIEGSWFVRRLTLTAAYGFTHAKGRPNFEIDVRTLRESQSFSAGMEYRVRSRLSVGVGAYRTSTSHDDRDLFFGTRIKEALDRSEDGVRFTARTGLTPKTSLGLRVDTVRSRFPLTPSRDSDGLRILPSVSFAANALISGSVSVGIRQLRPRDSSVPEFTGAVGSAELTYTLLGATRFTGRWERELDYSARSDSPYYVANTAGIEVRRQIIGRLDVILGTRRTHYDYRTLTTSTDARSPADRVRTYIADLGFRLTRDSRIGIALVDSSRDSGDQSNRNYRNRHLGLTFRYGL